MMNFKNTFQKIGYAFADALEVVALAVWACIKGIATIITFLIMFALLSALLPFSLLGIVLSPAIALLALILLLWFVYNHRQRVAMIIAIAIAFGLAVTLFNSIKYSLLPDWMVTKYSSLCRIHSWSGSFGATSIKEETLDTLTSYGTTALDTVEIKGPLTTYGRLTADTLKVHGKVTTYGHAELKNVDFKNEFIAYGRVELNDGIVVGKAKMYGKAIIEKCHMNDLVVYAKKIMLKASTVKNIYMREEHEKATVILQDSKIEGDIVFDGDDGRVILNSGASVGGKITGGHVIEK